MKKRIAINLTYTPSGGSYAQAFNLIQYLSRVNSQYTFIIISKEKNRSLLESAIIGNNISFIYYSSIANISTLFRVFWEQLYLPFLLRRLNIDILFCPGNISPIFTKTKTIQWIGTMGPFERGFYKGLTIFGKGKSYLNRCLMIWSAKSADKVIFESNFTKQLFTERFNFNSEKGSVLHIGKDRFFLQREKVQKNKVGSSSFILCVSHLYQYKNIENLIYAYEILLNDTPNKDINLLIAGGFIDLKYTNKIKKIVRQKRLDSKIKLLGAVNKNELRDLYINCKLLVFPSPFENFAYTLVEAMSCGSPIVAAETTAMPETCEDAAIYFDPYNIEDMSNKIKMVLNNKEVQDKLIINCQRRVNILPDYDEISEYLLNNVFKDV